MRDAEILASMVLEDAKSVVVIYGKGLPSNGAYLHANTDQELADKVGGMFGMSQNASLEDVVRAVQARGYRVFMRGTTRTQKGVRRSTSKAYGSGMAMDPLTARFAGLKPKTAVTVVTDPLAGRGSRVRAGEVIAGIPKPPKTKVSRVALPATVGFNGVTNPDPNGAIGVLVTDVFKGSPAAEGDIRRGDVITAGQLIVPGIESKAEEIRSMDAYRKFIKKWKPGYGLRFAIDRQERDVGTPVIMPIPSDKEQAV